MPEEFENSVFKLKMHQMFSYHVMPEEIENTAITSDFVFDENAARKIS